MSQQEMYPEDQGQQYAQEDAEILAQPYYWSTTPKSRTTGDIPKNEHPTTFEESIPAYGYHAQQTPYVDAVPNERSTRADELGEDARIRQEAARRQQQRQQEAFRRRFSPDGDAFEYGYRPYRNTGQWQVPPWARPQPGNRRLARVIFLFVLALIFAKPLLLLLGSLLAGIGILLGIAAFALLLPILILFALIVVFSVFALIALRVLGVPVGPMSMWRGWRSYRRRRRTWRW